MLTQSRFSSTTLLGAFVLLLSPCIGLAQANDAEDEPLPLNDENVVFLYESRAPEKANDEVFAYAMSEEFRDAKEEFTRYDIIQELRPQIKEKLSKADAAQTVSLTIAGRQLSEYDFDRQAFPVDVGDVPYITYEQGYDVKISNAEEMSELPVPLETARQLADDLQESRQVEYVVIGEVKGVEREGLTSRPRKIVEIQATRLVVKFLNGREVGALDL